MINKPEVKLLYNGKDCSKDFSKYLRSVSFEEFEDDQSDELTLTLNNHDGFFSTLGSPKKGDKLTCQFLNGADIFNCGSFSIDDNTFHWGLDGDTVEIKALAALINVPVRTNKTKNHSGKTLVAIAREIGKTHGFKVAGSEGFIKIGTTIQKKESDLSFLKRISKEYGYIFNIKNNILTFTSIESLENKKALLTLFKKDFKELSLHDSSAKMFGKCKVAYFDSKTKSTKTYTAVGNSQFSDTFTINKRCSSLTEAKRIAASALKKGQKEIKGTIELKEPLNNFIAGVNCEIKEIDNFVGLYHIKSTKRTIDDSGYRVTGEIECVSQSEKTKR